MGGTRGEGPGDGQRPVQTGPRGGRGYRRTHPTAQKSGPGPHAALAGPAAALPRVRRERSENSETPRRSELGLGAGRGGARGGAARGWARGGGPQSEPRAGPAGSRAGDQSGPRSAGTEILRGWGSCVGEASKEVTVSPAMCTYIRGCPQWHSSGPSLWKPDARGIPYPTPPSLAGADHGHGNG